MLLQYTEVVPQVVSNREATLILSNQNPPVLISKKDGSGYQGLVAPILWRQAAYLIETLLPDMHAQGGWLQLVDLPSETVDFIRESMDQYQGFPFRSTVHANMYLLDDAGFTSAGYTLRGITFLSQFYDRIWKYGLECEGKPVRFKHKCCTQHKSH
jgi:hypothetical protein